MPILRSKLPKSDWSPREVLDAKVLMPGETARCEFCNQRIRWIHVVLHDDVKRPMGAGGCCAVRLCDEYDAADAERIAKNYHQRRANFIDPSRWTVSSNDPMNIWRKIAVKEGRKQRKHILTVYHSYGQWGVVFKPRPCFAKFPSRAEAMAAAFDLVERVKR